MSNLTRPFSVLRRRPNLLDLLVPKSPTTQGYRLTAAANFDGVFSTILTADISSGYLDRNVDSRKLHRVNNTDHVRIVFDPATFSLTDTSQFWLKFVPVDFAGTPGTASAAVLILPEQKLRGDSVIAIAGTAPSGATVANSLPLLLPGRVQNLSIRNHEASTDLYVALEAGGAESLVGGGETVLSVLTSLDGAQGGIYVRGGGATAAFSATFTNYLPL